MMATLRVSKLVENRLFLRVRIAEFLNDFRAASKRGMIAKMTRFEPAAPRLT